MKKLFKYKHKLDKLERDPPSGNREVIVKTTIFKHKLDTIKRICKKNNQYKNLDECL